MYQNKIGMIIRLERLFQDGAESIRKTGIKTAQLVTSRNELLTKENAARAKELLGDIAVTSFWCGWSGPGVWDSVDGPLTLGIVPDAYRAHRLIELKRGADFAQMLGVSDMATHCGFIPEQPTYQGYRDIVLAVRHLGHYCAERGLHFNFETGQETPITLMRTITDVGLDNIGINFDPANLILYGKGNPVDAIDIFGDRIRGVHVKDGDYTKDYYKLGMERVVGEGSVNYPVFLPKLLAAGYQGDLYIEREITGEQQLADVQKTVTYIRQLVAL